MKRHIPVYRFVNVILLISCLSLNASYQFSNISNSTEHIVNTNTTNPFQEQSDNSQQNSPDEKRYDYHTIVIKFRPNSEIQLRGEMLASPAGIDTTPLQDLLQDAEANIQPRFKQSETQLNNLRQQAAEYNAVDQASFPDLNLYTEIKLDPAATYEEAALLLESLKSLDFIEYAYFNPIPYLTSFSPTTISNTTLSSPLAEDTPLYIDQQVYLNDAPIGIGARYGSWALPGGKGAGVQITDVEYGWVIDHEDLGLTAGDLIHGTNSDQDFYYYHGTASVGIIRGIENEYGITGIAPLASLKLSALNDDTSINDHRRNEVNAANAISAAVINSNPGDVILLELQFPGPDSNEACVIPPGQPDKCSWFEMVPVEYYPDVFDIIQLATASGITVIEASANGFMNLDNPIYERRFDPTYQDSGAIMVSAATSSIPHTPMFWANYGSRIDVYGWGENVFTTGYNGETYGPEAPNRIYTATYEGTSSASPMIAGAVAAIQGNAIDQTSSPLNPLAIRRKLRDTGTPQESDPRHIGNLPDIPSAIAYTLPDAQPVTLISPENAASTNLHPYLSWNADLDAIKYDVQLSTVYDFSSLLINTTVFKPGYEITTNLAEGTYFWRVRAYTYGTAGPWSDIWQFTTQSATQTFPRLGMLWPDTENQTLAEIARYDNVVFHDWQKNKASQVKTITPSLKALVSTSVSDVSYNPDNPAENGAVLDIPSQWFLTQVGSNLTYPVTASDTVFYVDAVTASAYGNTYDLFIPGDTALIGDESVLIQSVDSGTNSLTVQRGYIRPASTHDAGTRIAAHISFWPHTWVLNLSTDCPEATVDPEHPNETWSEYQARRAAELVSDSTWSGVVLDRAKSNISELIGNTDLSTARTIDPDNSNTLLNGYANFDLAWNKGLLELEQNLRNASGDDKIIYVSQETPNYSLLNGSYLEAFPDDNGAYGSTSWKEMAFGPRLEGSYFEWLERARQPNLTMIETYQDDSRPNPAGDGSYINLCNEAGFTPNYQKMRYGLTTALLNDGFYSYEMNTNGHGALCLLWFDEYDNAGSGRGYLGLPLNSAYQAIDSLSTENLVKGGTMDSLDHNGYPWYLYVDSGPGYEASVNVDTADKHAGEASARIDITQTQTGSDWQIQFSYQPFTLQQDKDYTLTFWAKADKERSAMVWAHHYEEGVGWKSDLSFDNINLTSEWEKYILSTTALNNVNSSQLVFGLAQATGSVWLDDVQLQEGSLDVYRRDFDDGVALVNASQITQTVSLGKTYQKIYGSQDPSINNGNLINTVTLPPHDGIIVVEPYPPVLNSLSTSGVTSGSSSFTLTLSGANFLNKAIVKWDGQADLIPTQISPTEIRVVIPASYLSKAGKTQISVHNPTNQDSNSKLFTITRPTSAKRPTITRISPLKIYLGGADFTLKVTGKNFAEDSVILWNGVEVETTYVKSTQLLASISGSMFPNPGKANIQVFTPIPGGGTSATKKLLINNPKPILSSVVTDPTILTASSGSNITLHLTGSKFVSNSVVKWNGKRLTTTYISSTGLTAVVPPEKSTKKGLYKIVVTNPSPGGGTSRTIRIRVY